MNNTRLLPPKEESSESERWQLSFWRPLDESSPVHVILSEKKERSQSRKQATCEIVAFAQCDCDCDC